MSCCKQPPSNELADYEATVPDSTFMCLARMAYELSITAEEFYTGRELMPWESLSDEVCAVFATNARLAVKGKPASDDPFDLLYFRLLRSLTANV